MVQDSDKPSCCYATSCDAQDVTEGIECTDEA